MADSSERTEKPTARRLEKARKEGDFPAAREFVSAVQFFAFVLLAAAWFPRWFEGVEAALKLGIRQAFRATLTATDLYAAVGRLAEAMLEPLALFGCILIAITLLLQIAATNMGFSMARLAPRFDRLNPAARLRELPGNNFVHFVEASIAIPLMFWLTWTMVRDRMAEILRLPLLPLGSGAAVAAELIRDAMKKSAFVLVVLGAIMLVRERRKYSNRLSMSKQDLRDEAKESEVNPQIKARVRRIQRDMRRKNMMRAVASASAVIVNPTHYAVALRYEPGVMAAPEVVAKGKNFLAARIRQRAIENQVPIVENPPLAQALYKSVDIGQEIPAHLYRAVAEILAYIFKLTNPAGRRPR